MGNTNTYDRYTPVCPIHPYPIFTTKISGNKL